MLDGLRTKLSVCSSIFSSLCSPGDDKKQVCISFTHRVSKRFPDDRLTKLVSVRKEKPPTPGYKPWVHIHERFTGKGGYIPSVKTGANVLIIYKEAAAQVPGKINFCSRGKFAYAKAAALSNIVAPLYTALWEINGNC